MKTHYSIIPTVPSQDRVQWATTYCGIRMDWEFVTRGSSFVTCGSCKRTVHYTVDVDIKAKYRDQLAEQAEQTSVESEYVDYSDLPDEFLELGHWVEEGQPIDLGTEHLPVEVVVHPFTLSLWFSTRKDDPRLGGGYSKFTFGDRENPKDLTVEEREYVRAVFELFLKGARESKT